MMPNLMGLLSQPVADKAEKSGFSLPGLPSLGLSTSTSSRSGDINAPNTVYFGGFGAGAGGGGLASVLAYWPVLLGGVVLFAVLRK